MAEAPSQRRLAAILAADMVGYSRMMEADEEGTLAKLKSLRRGVFDPLFAKHQGRVFKTTGDGVLVEFSSAVNAVNCAVELQRGLAQAQGGTAGQDSQAVTLRIGINLGDVMVEGGDLFGDGVNIAARLESIADPGSICISQSVLEQVKNKIDARFEEIGPRSIKNISQEVMTWRVAQPNSPSGKGAPTISPQDAAAPPSIAVLPFATMGGDMDQEMFADGLTEDLITDLARSAGLFVTARNSTFAYKGKPIDVRRIASELGVRYVLEGSARRAAGRVRINVQLIDAHSGNHLWAERYDRSLEDIFSVQDELTAKIVEALCGRLAQWQPRNRPKSLEAWECCVRARKLMEESPQAWREAEMLIDRAIELDPGYAEARRWQAMNTWIGWAHWGEPMEEGRRKSLEYAVKAIELDPNDAGCHWILGMILHYERRFDEAAAEIERALELDPYHADAWAERADLLVLNGEPEAGLESIQKAFRLNPIPPVWYYLLKGQAEYALGRYEAAVRTLRTEATYRTHSRRFLAAALAQLGRIDEAQREAKMFMVVNPRFRIGFWASTQPFKDEALRERFIDGLRKAGLPE